MAERIIVNSILEIMDGRPYIVNWRKKGELKIDACYFCGKKHEHGREEGHRVAHCLERHVDNQYDYNGIIITYRSGYIIREY